MGRSRRTRLAKTRRVCPLGDNPPNCRRCGFDLDRFPPPGRSDRHPSVPGVPDPDVTATAPLENTANNAVVPGQSVGPRERRAARWEKRRHLWRASSIQRVSQCGRCLRSTSGGVTARKREGVAGYAGLQHCGSVWACPVCSARIRVHRALEIGTVLGGAREQGHPLGFVTLTMSHNAGDRLGDLWAAVRRAWSDSTNRKAWTTDHRVTGWVRVWEVTHGRNGWHVHVHLVLVLAPGTTSADLDQVAGGLAARWAASAAASGRNAVPAGQDWHLAEGEQAGSDLADYLTKMADEDAPAALGVELTHVEPGRSAAALSTAPVWSVLDRLVETGEASALVRWHEWERESKGKRQVGWSAGLRDRFAPDVEELTDDQITEAEMGTQNDDLLRLTAEGWAELVRVPDRCTRILEALEDEGVPAAVALLDSWGVQGYEVL